MPSGDLDQPVRGERRSREDRWGRPYSGLEMDRCTPCPAGNELACRGERRSPAAGRPGRGGRERHEGERPRATHRDRAKDPMPGGEGR
jgi:hypothetical protein